MAATSENSRHCVQIIAFATRLPLGSLKKTPATSTHSRTPKIRNRYRGKKKSSQSWSAVSWDDSKRSFMVSDFDFSVKDELSGRCVFDKRERFRIFGEYVAPCFFFSPCGGGKIPATRDEIFSFIRRSFDTTVGERLADRNFT